MFIAMHYYWLAKTSRSRVIGQRLVTVAFFFLSLMRLLSLRLANSTRYRSHYKRRVAFVVCSHVLIFITGHC